MEISIRNGVAMVGKSSGVLCAAYRVVRDRSRHVLQRVNVLTSLSTPLYMAQVKSVCFGEQVPRCLVYLKGFPGTPSVACFHWSSAVELFDLWGTS